jgi:hypothetical protein
MVFRRGILHSSSSNSAHVPPASDAEGPQIRAYVWACGLRLWSDGRWGPHTKREV